MTNEPAVKTKRLILSNKCHTTMKHVKNGKPIMVFKCVRVTEYKKVGGAVQTINIDLSKFTLRELKELRRQTVEEILNRMKSIPPANKTTQEKDVKK